MRGLTRREFIGGAAGVAAVVALPQSGSTRAAFAPLAGATITPATYGVSNNVTAAKKFDGYVGLPLALTLQKIYMGHSSFPSPLPSKLTQLAAAGCHFLISVEPSMTMTPSERSRMASWLAMLNNAGISYRVVLFAEANNQAFATAQQWQTYWSYYAPAIKAAGVPCGYDPGCNSKAIGRALSYFPSNPNPDELWMDYYATSFRAGVRLDALIAKAQAIGISGGIGEWGWHAGISLLSPMTMPWWNYFGAYLVHLAQQKSLTLGANYFGSAANGNTFNVINTTRDPRIPVIQQVYNAVQAS